MHLFEVFSHLIVLYGDFRDVVCSNKAERL